MKVIYKHDKEHLGPGIWQEEPDEAYWEYKGYGCKILRNSNGALSGYVCVPSLHCKYKSEELPELEVHGGISYTNENKGLWWIGFDCAHTWDFIPKHGDPIGDQVYRNFDYVKNEVESLAKQLKDIEDENKTGSSSRPETQRHN